MPRDKPQDRRNGSWDNGDYGPHIDMPCDVIIGGCLSRSHAYLTRFANKMKQIGNSGLRPLSDSGGEAVIKYQVQFDLTPQKIQDLARWGKSDPRFGSSTQPIFFLSVVGQLRDVIMRHSRPVWWQLGILAGFGTSAPAERRTRPTGTYLRSYNFTRREKPEEKHEDHLSRQLDIENP